eukprot:3867551-Pyramimonas_sp.AAC.1
MNQRSLRDLSTATSGRNSGHTTPCCRPLALAGVDASAWCRLGEKVDELLLVLMHLLEGHDAAGEVQALEVGELRASSMTM